MNEPIRIVCAWRPSRDFPTSSVERLFKGCRRAAGSREIEFHCLTNSPESLSEPIVAHLTERPNWIYYWSKIELYLDTIVRNLDNLPDFSAPGMWMIRDVRHPKKWASGVMAWNTDAAAPFYDDFQRWKHERHFPGVRRPKRNRDGGGSKEFPHKGDQQYMALRREALGMKFNALQDVWSICSYKDAIRKRKRNPESFDIICFHGAPRPQDAPTPWVKRYLASLDAEKI